MTMNEDIKTRWADRLEEGKIAQTRGLLVRVKPDVIKQGRKAGSVDDLEFCCLGVLSLMAIQSGVTDVRLHMPQTATDSAYFEILRPPVDEYGDPTEGEDVWKQVDDEDLPKPVREWAGLRYANPGLGSSTCAILNDGELVNPHLPPGESNYKIKPHSFTEIAALIRQEQM